MAENKPEETGEVVGKGLVSSKEPSPQEIRTLDQKRTNQNSTTENIPELLVVQSEILLAEYKSLRDELMYFISVQRSSLNVLISATFGQTISIFLVEQEVILGTPFYLISLFAIPLFIFIVMTRSLDATARVLVIADYIHKGLKPRLGAFFSSQDDYFYWEEHKAQTRRVDRRWLHILDQSKWWVFAIGTASSFLVACWIGVSTETGLSKTLSTSLVEFGWITADSFLATVTDLLILGLFLNCGYVFIAVRAAFAFQETTGESRFVMGLKPQGETNSSHRR